MGGKRIKKVLSKFDKYFPQEEKLPLTIADFDYLEQVVYHTSQIPPGQLYPLAADEPSFTLPDLTLQSNTGGGLADPPQESGLRRQWTAYELLIFYRNAGSKNPREYAPRIQEHILQDAEVDDRTIDNIETLLHALKRCWAVEAIGKLEVAINSNNLAHAEDAFARLDSSDMKPVRDYALDKMKAYKRTQPDEPKTLPAEAYPSKRE